MKAIMDCERRPKAAWFTYREALTPLMANLRTERWACFSSEPMLQSPYTSFSGRVAPIKFQDVASSD